MTDMNNTSARDEAWCAAREAADLVIELPTTAVVRMPVEMFFRRIAASGPDGFRMGSRNRSPNEEPAHRVVIEQDFYLGTFVVTQEQWSAVWPGIGGWYGEKGPWGTAPGARPGHFRGSCLLPVEQVNWYDALFFCDCLTRTSRVIGGRTLPEGDWRFCLPTESEWEYACRGGRSGAVRDSQPPGRVRVMAGHARRLTGTTRSAAAPSHSHRVEAPERTPRPPQSASPSALVSALVAASFFFRCSSLSLSPV